MSSSIKSRKTKQITTSLSLGLVVSCSVGMSFLLGTSSVYAATASSEEITPLVVLDSTESQIESLPVGVVVAAPETGEATTEVVPTSVVEMAEANVTTNVAIPEVINEGAIPFRDNLQNDQITTLVSIDAPSDLFEDVVTVTAAPPPPPPPVTPPPSSGGSDSGGSVTGPAPVPLPAAGSIVETAMQYVGYPYVWGGTSPSGFDCSGFVQYVYAQHGISLPRVSGAQGASGTVVSASEAVPGDLVVWGSRHIAIYIGDGMIVHASTPSTGVKVSELYGSYYFSRVG